MTRDNVTERGTSTHAKDARGRIDALENHVPPGSPRVTERMSTIRDRVAEVEQQDSKQARRDLFQEIEVKLDQTRDAIEAELEDGKDEAQDLVDEIEDAVSNLRDDS